MYAFLLLLAIGAVSRTSAQRPPYAGQRPTGYKDRLEENNSGSNVAVVPLDNRFGGGSGSPVSASVAPTDANLPVAALGDAALVNTLNQRPADHRPFWLINYEAIEAQKNGGRRPTAASPISGPTAALPELTNRFADDDAAVVQQQQQQRPTAFTHGSANDAGNFLIRQPEIVYPLPAAEPTIPTTPTVIMLNGQPFLLTPLAGGVAAGGTGAPAVLVQQHPQQLHQNWLREQPTIYFD